MPSVPSSVTRGRSARLDAIRGGTVEGAHGAASVPHADRLANKQSPLGDGIWDALRLADYAVEAGEGEAMGTILDLAADVSDYGARSKAASRRLRVAYAQLADALRAVKAAELAEALSARCECCGSTAAVATYTRWIGGRGHVLVNECVNKPACWRRQDRQANARLASNEPGAA